MAQKLLIRDLTLRDGQQSSFATRMTQKQIDRVLPFYKDANFYQWKYGAERTRFGHAYRMKTHGTDWKKQSSGWQRIQI